MGRALVWGALWGVALPVLALAQTAQITGRVTDASAAVIPAAEVTISHTGTGVTRTTSSNEVGYFTMPLLPRGDYRVAVRHPGFRGVERSGILLDEGQILRLDFVLQIGEASESITISGAPSMIETATSQISTVVSNQLVVDLPMRGRNFFSLVGLVPGVRPLGGFNNLPVAAFGSSQASIGRGVKSTFAHKQNYVTFAQPGHYRLYHPTASVGQGPLFKSWNNGGEVAGRRS